MNEERRSAFLPRMAYLYLSLPFLIFSWGWFRFPIAALSTVVLGVSLIFAFRWAPKLKIPNFDRKTLIVLLSAALFSLLWVYFSGIGGFAFQNYDHMWRNAILELLIDESWPVVLSDSSPYFSGPIGFVYYFAFWLPAALFGKIFGLAAAESFLFIWAFIGVMLIFYLLLSLTEKFSIWPILVFIFFSGLDILGMLSLRSSADFAWLDSVHIENWAMGFQYSSHTTQIFWVFNQSIPAWIITLLILCAKDNRSTVFAYSFSVLSCSLPAIGMIPILGWSVISRFSSTYDKKRAIGANLAGWARELFTFQNLFGGGFIGIISFLFLKTNASGQNLEIADMDTLFMPYLFFVFFEVLIYFILIYRNSGHSSLYWVALVSLLIIPFFKVGVSIDFVMRASIPALAVLCVLSINALGDYIRKDAPKKLLAGLLMSALIFGSLTALHEIQRTAVNTIALKSNGQDVRAEHITLIDNYHRNNFFGEIEDSFFFEYIAKPKNK